MNVRAAVAMYVLFVGMGFRTQSFLLNPAIFPAWRIVAIRQLAQEKLLKRNFLHRTLSASNDDTGGQQQQTDQWLIAASKLRDEVRELEESAAVSRLGKKFSTGKSLGNTGDIVAEYTDIANSVWTISYRFANDPEESNAAIDDLSKLQRRLFGGNVTVKYRDDGYTDIISQQSYGSSTESCKLLKAWGWDIELAKEDEKDNSLKDEQYIQFSVDVELPLVNDGSTTTKDRFYFQARIDTSKRTGILSLVDGTVTVKRDIVQKSTRWGLFSPAGILAQFRYVGGFVAKPVQVAKIE